MKKNGLLAAVRKLFMLILYGWKLQIRRSTRIYLHKLNRCRHQSLLVIQCEELNISTRGTSIIDKVTAAYFVIMEFNCKIGILF